MSLIKNILSQPREYSVTAKGIFCHCQRNILSLPREYSVTINGIFSFCQENILSLPREYSVSVSGIFSFCQENILSLLGDVADDVAVFSGKNSGGLVFPANFRRNFGELYRARFNSDFDDLYIAGLVSTRGISVSGQNQDLRTLKILQL